MMNQRSILFYLVFVAGLVQASQQPGAQQNNNLGSINQGPAGVNGVRRPGTPRPTPASIEAKRNLDLENQRAPRKVHSK